MGGITIARAMNLVGSGMQSGGILVAAVVSSNTDILHYVPQVGGAERGCSIRDLSISVVSGTPGRHVVHFDTTSFRHRPYTHSSAVTAGQIWSINIAADAGSTQPDWNRRCFRVRQPIIIGASRHVRSRQRV